MSGLRLSLVCLLLLTFIACGDDAPPTSGELMRGDTGQDVEQGDSPDEADAEPDIPEEIFPDLDHPPASTLYDFAGACVSLGLVLEEGAPQMWLTQAADGFGFADDRGAASQFFLKASDLGTFLLYDQEGGYLVQEEEGLVRKESLDSDVYLGNDTYISGAEWDLEFSRRFRGLHQLRNRRSGELLVHQPEGERARSADLVLEAMEGCTEHPEMSLDAEGSVTKTTFEDGELFGFVDTHSHILSNFGFGGGGLFHGSPFHRLGVEHAMGDCEPFHGPEGRADFLSWGFSDMADPNLGDLTNLLTTGLLPERLHGTPGWPVFEEWPNQDSATHQTQYYRWLERAWLSGLRLVVQHAVSNEAICDIMTDTGFQTARWGCEDMTNIDRQLLEVRNMEAYIDAQSGGPGEGWFRIVESPAEAREVIEEGKMAVVLGIEVPNLFECYLTRRPGGPICDDAHIEAQLDLYHEKGVRVLFPNHKYDNAFTPGDGDKGILEVANVLQTGHWNNYIQDCPEVSTVFDDGSVRFGGFNQPRDEYLSEAPNELIQLTPNPIGDLLPYLDELQEPALEGDWCQKGTLTPAGVTLMRGIMARGMIPEIDHLPRRSYLEVFGMLEEAQYPAAATHGNTHNNKLYDIGGISKTGFGRCANPEEPGSLARSFRSRSAAQVAAGIHPSVGFGFDLNGLAGVPDARFGEDANCAQTQEDPVTYPFTSFGGDVTFTQPQMGQRVVDFNTEGMIHIGLVPEIIEDARRTGATDEDMEILFRSAEGYLKMWERAQARAQELTAP